ncbi:MAG: helix-turn-helix domain-containing protein, partial [Candidatus Aenigmatarchaeota archaeon]
MGSTKPQTYYNVMSPSEQRVWDWLSKNAPYEEEFELDQSGLAKTLGVSRATISHALKTFISANLLAKTRSKTGRGNGCLFQFIWEFTTESVTPKKKESTQRKKNYPKNI